MEEVVKRIKSGGRQKGTPNKNKIDIKAAAALHGKAALDRLVHLMTNADSQQVQVAAAREILDRAYGKPVQAIEGSMDLNISHEDALGAMESAVAASEVAASDAAYH